MTITSTLTQPWSAAQKWGFRFAFIFFLMFIFLNPNGAVPLLSETFEMYIIPMHKLIVWAAANVLHLAKPVTQFTGGSGDTTYDWLVLLFITVSALVGSVVWSLVSRKPVSYDRLYYWLLVILRFYVGFTMLSYGSVKIVKLQFPMPGPSRLLQAYGDSSPMSLAWTFIGYSKGYNYFTGIAEVLCGALLLFRRTTLLGAIIAFTVAANIVAINYCYDVPVKIVSSALLLMTIFILLKNLDRIIKFFFLNQQVQPAVLTPRRFQKKWKNITLTTVKYLLIAYVVLSTGSNVISSMPFGDDAKRPVLYGIFNTREFVLGKDTLPPLQTDTNRWRRLIINGRGGVRVMLMNDSVRPYKFDTDTVKKVITLGSFDDTTKKYKFKYTLSKDSVLQMTGKGPNGDVSASFKRFDEKQFLLIRRGFHWVNEFPFNR
ncbi:hypothetical protein [Mucilaginibacter myungsuensis]|uniref:DoxX-like protein n=1 Tax=Mucilaginibacter myungsuensis TaxID=649104 RepID=A0A929PXC0_9SPHI|nr:hypothetical protein [Mucilaginibacter myungsuensis]MBE9662077.1 hypothetical protein [Mucilaginibacter myungsuensis]MDN3599489.1 hypothetical protein [Mucilaginibacter myungsuensis]